MTPMEEIGLTIFRVFILAILVEAMIETLKPTWDKDKGWNIDVLWTMALSVFITVLSGQDVFTYAGIPLFIPGLDPALAWHQVISLVLGAAGTGIIVSRGSSYIHDLIKMIKGEGKGSQAAAVLRSRIEGQS